MGYVKKLLILKHTAVASLQQSAKTKGLFFLRTRLLGALATAIIFTSGCAHVAPPPPQATPQIQQSRNSYYGQLEGWQPVSFVAQPFNSLNQHSFSEEGGDYDPDVSADGKWLVFSSLRHAPTPDLYLKQQNGSTATRLTSDPASEIQPSFSPTGDKVAFASNRSGSWDIWVIGTDGTNATRLTSDSSNDIHPSWAPDGRQIVYCSNGSRSGQWELWIVDVDRPSVKKWIGYGLFPEWSPNPQVPKIAFQLARQQGSKWFSIWTVDMVDDEAKFPTEIISSIHYACVCPAWSADGSQLCYSTVGQNNDQHPLDPAMPDSSGENIWLIDLDGRNNLRLTHDTHASNYAPTWSHDGRVFFCSDREGIDNIWSIRPHQLNFATGPALEVSQKTQQQIQAN